MNTLRTILSNIAIAAAAVVAAACVPGGEVPGPGPVPVPSGKVVVRFGASMFSSRLGVTRAADDAEFAVGNISLLVFAQEGGTGDFTYRYTAIGRRLDQPGGAAIDFDALLTASADPVRLLAVANHADGFSDALQPGTTEAEVRDALTSTSYDFSQGLPMTGVAELPSISDAVGIVWMPLIRSVAKASVTVDPDDDSPAFTITGVEVWRAPATLQIFPDAACIASETTAPVPLAPSLPFAESTLNVTLTGTADGGTFSGYLFENPIAPPPEDDSSPAAHATCLVVSVRRTDDNTDSFYRVNFGKPGDSANPVGQVLRNYWYEFTIVGVDGPGWPTAAEAATNPASGLRTTATPWSGGGNTDYWFGHNDFIRLSDASAVLPTGQNQTTTMTITTSGTPFSLSSVHHPGAGLLEVSGQGGTLRTQPMSFQVSPLASDPGEQRWLLTITAQTNDPTADYLQLHAADGLMTIVIAIARDPSGPPVPNDRAKRKIRVLNLGSVTYGSMNRQTTLGVPAMLRNTSYFGPEGTVVCAGFEFLPMLSNANSLTNADAVRTALEGADIIVTPYNYRPDERVSDVIYAWLNAPNSGRTAFLSMDEPESNFNLRGLLDGATIWRNVGYIANDPVTDHGYGPGYTGLELPQPPASGEDPAAPFLDGVFGNARNCDNPDVTPYDGTTLYFNIAGANSQIIPLIVSYGNAGQNTDVLMVGVDPVQHVVYNGCATLLHTEGMFGPTANTTLAYNPANYLNAMWSNTWAWAVDRVMSENYDVPEAMVE